MTMIEKGKEYYLVSKNYDWIEPMTTVKALLVDGDKDVFVRDVIGQRMLGQKNVFGYVKPHELLTLDQILKLRDDHLEMMEAIERHG